MANEENLIPNSERTPSELREMTQKGGRNSGISRRRKKSMKQKLQALLELKSNAEATAVLNSLGIPEEEQDNETWLLVSMFLAATEDRDTKAYDRLMDVLGRTVQREELALKKKLAKSEKQSHTVEKPTSRLYETLGEENGTDYEIVTEAETGDEVGAHDEVSG